MLVSMMSTKGAPRLSVTIGSREVSFSSQAYLSDDGRFSWVFF